MSSYSTSQWIFLAAVFLVVSGLPIVSYLLLRRNPAQQRLERVLGAQSGQTNTEGETPAWIESIAKVAGPLAKVSLPDEGWEHSELRRRFIQAGWRAPSAPVLFFALKTVLAIGLPLLVWLAAVVSGADMPARKFILYAGLLCGVGFYLPNFLLNRTIKRRQRDIFENFPDALDLLTICVEAGLSLEAALNRVASEMQLKSSVLAEELQMVCLEFRAGSGKERALRNLSLRTGVEDIDTLVAMLIQSDKFGTSMGESLRIHSEMLRVKRQQRAEETAAKVAVKLMFPLIFFIFPSILIVVAGPAMIRIIKELPKMVGGGS